MDYSVFITGFTLGLSLILAIGAQNAFVLKQGLKKQHVFIVCFICALSDAVLISAGVAGFGTLVKEYPSIETISRYAGAAFLIVYALLSFKSALTQNHGLQASGKEIGSMWSAALTCLAFTWLNPHVYLDTVVLLGSISTQYEEQRYTFNLGAIVASFVFFFSLGYGARLLIPVFNKPMSWKILEFIIGVVMALLALNLVLG